MLLPGLGDVELAAADAWATGVTPNSYPTQFLRPRLDAMGVVPADGLLSVPDGSRVVVGERSPTASVRRPRRV